MDVATWNVATAGELIMRKQVGKTQPVKGRSSRKRAQDSGKTKTTVSSKRLVRRTRRANVPSAAAAAVIEGPTTPTEGDTITLASCALVLPENQTYEPGAASAAVTEGSTTPTEENTITLPSCALVLPEDQADGPDAAAAVPEESATPTEEVSSTLASCALVLRENQTYVPGVAGTAVFEGPTTPMEGDTTTLALRALVLRKNQAYVPGAAAAAIFQGWTSALERYWGRELIGKEKVMTIMMMPFVAWHAYQTRLQQRRNAMQMLVRGCVVRPADVDLHYITSVRKLSIGIEAPDSQPFRDMELTFCPVPLATEMRARGKQLLQWLRHELAANYLPKLWKFVEEENGGTTFWLAKPTKPRTGRKMTHSLGQ
jgi:hypothetical protein